MSDVPVKAFIDELFEEMGGKIQEKLTVLPSPPETPQRIAEYVCNAVEQEISGYLEGIYYSKTQEVLRRKVFQTTANTNRFYDLELRLKLSETHWFDVKNTHAIRRIFLKKIPRAFATASVAVGVLSAGGIAKLLLDQRVSIPLWLILLTAVLAGFSSWCIITQCNKSRGVAAVDAFLTELKGELLDWVSDVAAFIDEQVEQLVRTL